MLRKTHQGHSESLAELLLGTPRSTSCAELSRECGLQRWVCHPQKVEALSNKEDHVGWILLSCALHAIP